MTGTLLERMRYRPGSPTVPENHMAAELQPTGSEAALPVRRERWGPWTTLLWASAAGAIWMAAQLGGAILFLFWWRSAFPDHPLAASELGMNGPAIGFAIILATPLLFAVLYLATRLAGISFDEYLALKWPRVRHAFLAFAGLVLLLIVASAADASAGKDMPPFVLESFRSARDAGMLPLLVFAFAVLGPLQEEVMFRGFLYRGFALGFGSAFAVLLTSAGWAILHAQYEWYFVAQIFVLGLYFGWVRWMSGSTLLAFLLHAMINATAIAQAAARLA
jgi:membrane protease YdiL (CAAX protease family)